MRLLVNGFSLNVEQDGRGEPVALLHGFTGSAISWQSHLPALTSRYRVIRLDAMGHGLSDSPPDALRYGAVQIVADFWEVLDQLGLEKVNLLGYSMGGRMALQIALNLPERVNKLILESTSPGIADLAERETRRESDNALADRIERDGIEKFVAYWENIPLFASQVGLSSETRAMQLAQRLQNNPTGLANSLRGFGAGVVEPVWDRLSELTLPVLLIAGQLDHKYVSIAEQMAACLPNVQTKIIANAGHTAHLEQPTEFDNILLNFLADA